MFDDSIAYNSYIHISCGVDAMLPNFCTVNI